MNSLSSTRVHLMYSKN